MIVRYLYKDETLVISSGAEVAVPMKGDVVQIKGELYNVTNRLIQIIDSTNVICAYLE